MRPDTITILCGTLGNKISDDTDYQNVQELEAAFEDFTRKYDQSRKAKTSSALFRHSSSLRSAGATVKSLLTAFTSNKRYSGDSACMVALSSFSAEMEKSLADAESRASAASHAATEAANTAADDGDADEE